MVLYAQSLMYIMYTEDSGIYDFHQKWFYKTKLWDPTLVLRTCEQKLLDY